MTTNWREGTYTSCSGYQLANLSISGVILYRPREIVVCIFPIVNGRENACTIVMHFHGLCPYE
jgi:hypothetical protein